MQQWILDNTTASSNSKNVTSVKLQDGTRGGEHVIHWRTETIQKMWQRCKMEVEDKYGMSVSKSYFYKCIPSYVRPKKKQEGLCPIHFTGHELSSMLVEKRNLWHKQRGAACTCSCVFCSSTGCNHGKNPNGGKCNLLTCHRCSGHKCPLEWNLAHTNWR